jgi:hypothetical protein
LITTCNKLVIMCILPDNFVRVVVSWQQYDPPLGVYLPGIMFDISIDLH